MNFAATSSLCRFLPGQNTPANSREALPTDQEIGSRFPARSQDRRGERPARTAMDVCDSEQTVGAAPETIATVAC
jgi:hypothetical protein